MDVPPRNETTAVCVHVCMCVCECENSCLGDIGITAGWGGGNVRGDKEAQEERLLKDVSSLFRGVK